MPAASLTVHDPLARHLRAMAFNNAWANHRLLGACARLSQIDFEAPRVGFFPSIRATLNHTLTVDRMYLDAMERARRGDAPHPDIGSFFDPEEPFADCAGLWREQRAIDRRLIDYCDAQTDAVLKTLVTIQRPHGAMRDTRARLLAHLFQHQIHHRGQAHAMLSATPVAPPQLDEFFLAGGDAALRAADFAELGFTEALIWGARPAAT